MDAIRIRRHIESETLRVPELRPIIGMDAEIIILVDDPAEPKPEGNMSAFFAAADPSPVDPDALHNLRNASRL